VGRTIMGAVVSLDGFIAHDDDVGPLFDSRLQTPGSSSRTRTLDSQPDQHGLASAPACHLPPVRL
jgi:hypothetical protein